MQFQPLPAGGELAGGTPAARLKVPGKKYTGVPSMSLLSLVQDSRLLLLSVIWEEPKVESGDHSCACQSSRLRTLLCQGPAQLL